MKKQVICGIMLVCMLFMSLGLSTALAEPGTVAVPANVGDVTTHRYHSIQKMRDDVYHISDDVIKPLGGIEGYNPSSMYLIIGTERALLIDAGNSGVRGGHLDGNQNQDEYQKGIREILGDILGDKPFDVAITHRHGDHTGLLPAFEDVTVYYPEGDRREDGTYGDNFEFIGEGYVFELGDITLETVNIPGHTPGGLVYLSVEDNLIATGDALGSTFIWLFGEGAIDEYYEPVKALNERIKESPDMLFMTGHHWQQLAEYPARGHDYTPVNDPMTIQYVSDMVTLCEKIFDGSAEWVEYIVDGNPRGVAYLYGHAQICSDIYEAPAE